MIPLLLKSAGSQQEVDRQEVGKNFCANYYRTRSIVSYSTLSYFNTPTIFSPAVVVVVFVVVRERSRLRR